MVLTRRFLLSCIYNVNTQHTYNRALYTYVRISTSTGIRCNHCVHGLATGQIYCFQLFEIHSVTASYVFGVHAFKEFGDGIRRLTETL